MAAKNRLTAKTVAHPVLLPSGEKGRSVCASISPSLLPRQQIRAAQPLRSLSPEGRGWGGGGSDAAGQIQSFAQHGSFKAKAFWLDCHATKDITMRFG